MANARIEALRQDALDFPGLWFDSQEMRYHYAKGWQEARSERPLPRRHTMAVAAMHRGMTPIINEHELIVGRQNFEVQLTDEQKAFLEVAQSMMPGTMGQDAHMAPDYEKLLHKGTEGVRAEVRAYLEALDVKENPNDVKKQVFYQDCLILLDALDDMAANYAAHARELAKTATPARRAELEQIAANLDVVPRYPAKTFWQALQSVQMLYLAITHRGLYQGGRPDQYLLEYYERDIAAGILTPEQAQELIDCFCILYCKTTAKALAIGLMVGGRYPDGRPVENDLTWMFIRSIGHTRLSYPGIGLCVTPQTSDALLELAVRTLGEGHTHPALFNDEVIAQGLMDRGLPFEEAVSYIHSTCVEITPIKSSAVWVASPYRNVMKPLLELVRDLAASGDKGDFDSFKAEYKRRLRAYIDEGAYHQNMARYDRNMFYSNPLVSCFTDDCLARGLDIDHGGAKYNFIMPSFVGMANLIDAMIAIKHLVYEDGSINFAQYVEAIDADFVGHEALLKEINDLPKYGNDVEEPDALMQEMTAWIPQELAKVKGYDGCEFVPSMFCWTQHAELGKNTGATPDGRRAGFPLGDGSGPAQGRELCGPTASILSSTCWNHVPFTGGIAVNMKFSKALFNEQSVPKLCDMVRVYMERGGFELQVNVVDRAALLDARVNPDAHRDLVVRIGGYSDYFTNLSPQMQDEVLLRTEHEL